MDPVKSNALNWLPHPYPLFFYTKAKNGDGSHCSIREVLDFGYFIKQFQNQLRFASLFMLLLNFREIPFISLPTCCLPSFIYLFINVKKVWNHTFFVPFGLRTCFLLYSLHQRLNNLNYNRKLQLYSVTCLGLSSHLFKNKDEPGTSLHAFVENYFGYTSK